MKKIMLAVAMSTLAAGAMAADLPSRSAPPVFVPPPPVFTWTGYYIGVTAGYAFNGDHSFNNTAPFVGQPAYVRNRASGFTGGGEIGYNYEFANTSYFGGTGGVVIGVEADAAYVGPGSDSAFVTPGGVSTFHSRTEFVGTARGRLGYAFNNFLVYGTGGFAYGGVDDNVSVAGAGVFNGNRSTLRTGYAYGGGLAYALPTTSFVNFFRSSAVTFKAEFIHYDLGTSNILVASPATSFVSQVKTQGNLIRAGIDYKIDFSGAPAPIVAKY
jgi:outer membrane immunogenic protein